MRLAILIRKQKILLLKVDSTMTKIDSPTKSIREGIREVGARIYGTIVDTDNWTSKENLGSVDILKRTARYKLAGIGIPVNKNEKNFSLFIIFIEAKGHLFLEMARV